ncbi:MAG: N-acetyltransferase [Cytophagales bacterium]|nr:N-acetyltransferase [Cytophagales bacterium]
MNEAESRFEVPVGNETALLDYRWHNGHLALTHTFVPEAGRGKGIASALAKHALDYAKDQNLKVEVYCTYVAGYLKQHPEYQSLVVRSV